MKFIFATIFAFIFTFPAFAAEKTKESTYDRVMRTGTIRCGYFSWYPASRKDPLTGEIKGIAKDYMDALGEALSLKIEWAEEIGLSDYPVALETGRIDAMCGIWPTATRARIIDFPAPIYYQPLYGFARTDDTRFDQDFSVINDPQYTMAVLEGGVTSIIRARDFPLAKPYELPQLTSPAELFVSLLQGKADVAIYDLFTYGDFNASNPGKIKQVTKEPIRVFPNSIAIARGQEEFRWMIYNATQELLLSGAIDDIIDNYDQYEGAILRVSKPYDPAR